MPTAPWFKFFSADYLLDPDVDAIPPEAEGLLVRMWCICHREGSCPAAPEEIARKTCRSLQYVLQCKRHCEPFFELQGGRFYSRRMEEEKNRSKQAGENASCSASVARTCAATVSLPVIIRSEGCSATSNPFPVKTVNCSATRF